MKSSHSLTRKIQLTTTTWIVQFCLTSVSTLALYGRSWPAELLTQVAKDDLRNKIRTTVIQTFAHNIHKRYMVSRQITITTIERLTCKIFTNFSIAYNWLNIKKIQIPPKAVSCMQENTRNTLQHGTECKQPYESNYNLSKFASSSRPIFKLRLMNH
jgi:hypothetical protein